jgi:hypothetical protein
LELIFSSKASNTGQSAVSHPRRDRSRRPDPEDAEQGINSLYPCQVIGFKRNSQLRQNDCDATGAGILVEVIATCNLGGVSATIREISTEGV